MRPDAGLRRKLLLLLAAAAAAVACLGLGALKTYAALRDANQWVQNTQQVIGSIQALRAEVDRERAAVVDYTISGDEALRLAFEDSKLKIWVRLDEIRKMTRDDAPLQARLDALVPLIADWLGRDNTLATRKRAGASADISSDRVASDRKVVNQVRDAVEALRQHEQVLLSRRINEVRSRAGTAAALALAGAVLSLGVLLLGGGRAMADLDRRLALERMREEISHHVNHELRGPVSSIVTALSLLNRNSPTLDRRSVAEAGLIAAHQLKRMADDLLDVTRLETGKLSIEASRIDASEILKQCLTAASLSAGAKREIGVEGDVPDGLFAVADPIRLRQIVGNLLDNAVKFSPSGASVRLEARKTAVGLSVSVADRGPGIPPADLDKVFDRLYQTALKAERGSKGLGLGLAICRELVERQGGTIRAENSPSGGAVLTFTLPLA